MFRLLPDSALPRRIFFGLLTGGVAALAALVLVSIWIAMRGDARAADDARLLVQSGVDGLRERVGVSVTDYSWWEEALDDVLADDLPGIYSNLGSGAMKGSTFDLLAIRDVGGGVRYAWKTDGGEAPDPSLIDPALADAMAALLDDVPLQPVTARTAFATVDGRPMLLGAARLSPYTFDGVVAERLPVVVAGLVLSDGLVAEIGTRMLIDGLSLDAVGAPDATPDAEIGGLALAGPDGRPIAHLRWTQPTPGTDILRAIWPWIALAGGGVLAVFVVAALRAQRHATVLVAERGRADRAATSDALTGLMNRAGFARLQDDPDVQRALDADAAALIYLDLDRFKQLNDRLGHEAGDEALRVTARRLAGTLRAGDHVARLGGDEFVVLLLGNGSRVAARRVVEAVMQLTTEPIRIGGEFHVVQVSAGVAHAAMATDLDDLMTKADAAMYSAKEDGGARAATFDAALFDNREEERRLEARLRAGLVLATEGASPFHVAYQPILRTEDRALGSVEALLRWTDPELGAVPPGRFIPVAEQTGLIPDLGRIVLRQACADMAAWPDLNVSVNVSAVQLRDFGFPDEVESIVLEAGVEPHRVTLELTETALVELPHQARERMETLRRAGFRLALDDFGTGFSSISYLKRFRFDTLKIDRSFVGHLGDARADLMFQSIVQMSKAFRLDVVAEGVETTAQESIIRLSDCNYEQGFLLERPIPFRDLAAKYRDTRPADPSAARRAVVPLRRAAG